MGGFMGRMGGRLADRVMPAEGQIEERIDPQVDGVIEVHTTPEYHRARIHMPYIFDEFRTPAWGIAPAESIAGEGAKIVTGRHKKTGEWRIQSILIPRKQGRSQVDSAKRTVEIVKEVEGEIPER